MTILSPAPVCRTMRLVDIPEVSAISILQALAAGEVNELSREHVQNLENTMKTGNLPMIGAPGVNRSMVDLISGGGKPEACSPSLQGIPLE